MAITERNNAQTNPLEGGAITDSSEASQVTAKKARIQWSTVPAFVLFLFYVQVASAAALISTILGFDVSNATMCQHFLRILRTRFAHSSSSQPVLDDTTRPVIFLSNHRSWGDFWVDCALLGGPSFVSRWLVALGIPASAVWGSLSGWLWFFSRGKKRSEGTTKWMQKFLSNCHARCPGKGVVLYPEGTRSLEPKGLPFKGWWPCHCLQSGMACSDSDHNQQRDGDSRARHGNWPWHLLCLVGFKTHMATRLHHFRGLHGKSEEHLAGDMG